MVRESSIPLFWRESYWNHNRSDSGETILISSEGQADLYLSRGDGQILVPGPATFGGWWPTHEAGAIPNDWGNLFEELFRKFPQHDWSISLPPSYFFPEIFFGQAEALRQLGAMEITEINSTVPITAEHLVDSSFGFSRGNRKRIRAFESHGGVVRQAREPELDRAFELLEENRNRRGVTLSMNREKFVNLVRSEPGSYRCWLAVSGSELLGAALTVEVHRDVTYVLYWGDSLAGRKISVTASICKYLLKTAASNGKKFLDIGVSSNRGDVDEGLLRFKNNLGARTFDQSRFFLGHPASRSSGIRADLID